MTTESWQKVLDTGRWILLLVALAVCAVFLWEYSTLPSSPIQAAHAVEVLSWPETPDFSEADWNVFRKRGESDTQEADSLARRFRLAGTFFSFTSGNTSTEKTLRKAILDDLEKKKQFLVSEGDPIEEYEVARIYSDRVVLRSGGVDEVLRLSFMGGSVQAEKARKDAPRTFEEMPALETSIFGKRVGESQWVFKREALMEYYDEVLNDAERLADLFMSMKPDYTEGVIAGYYLETEGEKDFYDAVGLREGDTVRKVNSMRMTSRARAEYFIREFVNDRVNAVVLDIERGGEEQKLIYLIR
ncbi:MAG: hypothetical protein KJ626_13335 [Verrucomicrobia bacterium]|nr:hypothetical protein [Verrucomicrobiota bacterium]